MSRLLHICVCICYFAVSGNSEDIGNLKSKKAVWISETFSSLTSGKYERVKAFAWWNENFDRTNLRIDTSSESLEVYRRGVSDPIFSDRLRFQDGKLSVAGKKIYHGANPGFGGTEDKVTKESIISFETLVGKKIAWVYFSNNWDSTIRFPEKSVQTIYALGRTPFIRLMPRSDFRENTPDPVYSLQRIIDGDFDKALTQWAKDAKKTNVPLLLEFGCEANGDWFPWSGLYNGGKRKDGYGDPQKADGPERFRDAYRHIIDLFRKNGVDNVTWFFHIDAKSTPSEPWNRISEYYPGDNYIDWIGISVYGPQEKADVFQSFTEIMNDVYMEIIEMTKKPIAIVELGITEI